MPASTAFIQAQMQQALALHQTGRLAAAQGIYEAVIRQEPKNADAHHFLGVIAYQNNEHRRAVDLITAAIGLFPTNPAAYSNRARALQALANHVGAVASYDQAIALNADFLEAHFYRAGALQEIGQLEAAVAGYDRVIALRPRAAEAYFNRGNALKDLGRFDEALQSFHRVLELEPDNLDAKRNVFWLNFITFGDPALLERLSADIAAGQARNDAAQFASRKSMADFRVLHDLEQTDYLLARGHNGPALRAGNASLRGVYARAAHDNASKQISLSQEEAADIIGLRQQPIRYQPKPLTRCLNPETDWAGVEDAYFRSSPEIVVIDNLLCPEVLAELREFCLASQMWTLEFKNQYLGVLAEGGFIGPLHMQIAEDLRRYMPRIFGAHLLEQLWAFKYTSTLGRGINVHADYARINLNFWITPDEANLDPASGGLVVYDVPAPLDWGFEEYNKNDSGSIYSFLKEAGAESRRIPYKCNRAILFNSRLFHETDDIRFKDGFANRRVNVTYLFGRGLGRR